MAFSGALTLTDLNDFITPAQACIKPVEQLNVKPSAGKEAGAAETEIHIDSSGAYYEVLGDDRSSQPISSGKQLEQAQISLNDCLACSGCITSAESVLITLQSHTEVLTFLEANSPSSESYKIPVISIAPQSLASLAASLSFTSATPITSRQVLRRIQLFCKNVLGFAHVFDTTFARHLALREHVAEFEERKSKDQAGGEDAVGQLPMLASACPGWICYAEKAHSEMLPFIANTKSPQQVMGTLVKEWMGAKWGQLPQDVYHVSVMPCYDKKLEASRQDFYNETYSTRDVDCVITTGELELMMREKEWDLSLPRELDDAPWQSSGSSFDLPELVQHPGSSSGSYLQSIISRLITSSSMPLQLSVKTLRNTDYEEYILTEVDSGKVVFKGAKCYGFRNLQNVVRKVGRERGVRVGGGAAGKLSGRAIAKKRDQHTGRPERLYDYIEVMACPGGCVNGGGQLKVSMSGVGTVKDAEGYPRNWEEQGVAGEGMPSTRWGDKEWTRKVEEAYWHDRTFEMLTPPSTPPSDGAGHRAESALEFVDRLAQLVHRELADEKKRGNMMRTQYRAVESEVVGLAVKW